MSNLSLSVNPSFRGLLAVMAIGLLLFLMMASQAQAAPLDVNEQHQVAALFVRLDGLKKILDSLVRLSLGGLAQVSSTQCSDGIDNDSDALIDYPADTGCYSAADTTEAYDSTTGTGSTWSSCSSSLTALLGTGCHQMYTDSSGNPIYCNSGMNLSAKSGDTATTPGCSSSTTSSTPSTTLNTVNDLTATYRSASNDVELRWTDGSVGEDEYKIWRRTTGGSYSSLSSKTRPYDDGSPLTYYDSAPPSNSTLEYIVKACTTSGSCAASDSNIGYVTVGGTAGDTTPPSAPTLSAVAISSTKVDLYIGASSDNTGVTGYKIFKNEVYLSTITTLYYADTAAVAGTAHSYTVKAIDAAGNESVAAAASVTTPSTTTTTNCSQYGTGWHTMDSSGICFDTNMQNYRTVNGTLYSCASTPATGCSTGGGTATTTTTTTTLNTVYDLAGSYSSSANNINITWTENSVGEDYYKIYRRSLNGSWTLWFTMSRPYNDGTALTYTDAAGMTSGSVYEYKVAACTNAGSCASDSNIASVTVGGSSPNAPTNAPTGLSAVQSGNDALLSWSDSYWRSEYNYKIERKLTGGSWTWGLIGSVSASGSSGSYRDAAPYYGSYEYRVKSCNTYGCSPDSNAAYLYISSTVAATSTATTTPVTTSCDSTLIALLGSGCHQMYTDSSGNPTFCDGSMTKSAKRGDAAVTQGCQGSTYVPSGQLEQIWNNLGLRSSIRNDASQTRITSLKQACINVPPGANVWLPGSGDYASPDFGMPDSAKCSRAAACTSTQYFDGSSCVATGVTAGAQCSDGRDNDGDGFTDYPSDSSCYGREDNDEYYPVGQTTATTSALYLNYLSPSYGSVGTVVTIYGSGFVSSGNRINFDTGVIMDIPSYDGKTLKFSVPEDRVPLCAVTDPRCLLPAPYNPVKAGTYRITVTNSQGTTGSALFFTISDTSKSCPAGYHLMQPDTYSSSGYCMADNDLSSCQPLGGGAGYRCPSTPGPVACDTTLLGLLGTGCHFMFNDSAGNQIYCDGNMTKSAKKGDTTTTPGCQPGGGQPNLPFAVDVYGTYPRDGERGTTLSRVRVKFTREIDLASTISQFFSLAPTNNPSATLNGSFQFLGDSFEFISASPLQSGTSYTYKVFTTIKERGGTPLPSQFTATFTTAESGDTTAGTIEGSVKEPDGQPLAGAFVAAYKTDYSAKSGSISASDGTFKLTLSPGNYVLEVYSPPDKKDLVRPYPQKVSVTSGPQKAVTFQFGNSPKAVSGSVKFSGGSAVTDAEVGAFSLDSYQWRNTFTDATGAYTLRLGGGKWKVGIRPKDPANAKWTYNGVFPEATFARNNDAELQLVDFTVPVFDASLKVLTVDDQGKALPDVGVIVDTIRSGQKVEDGLGSSAQFRISDSSGSAKFTLRSNKYYVRGYAASDRGYLNPPEQEVTTPGGKTTEIKLVFTKKTAASSLSLKGVVKLEEGIPTDAFVWAWSERGGYVSTFAGINGTFEIKVGPNERWHIGAGKSVKNVPYKSTEVVVETKESSLAVEIILAKLDLADLPPPVVIKETATKQIVAQADDGAKAVIPPQAAASSGNISVEVKPTVEAPSQAGSSVVSTVYDVSIRDSAGKSVTNLNSDIEIIIPYDEAELKAKGVKEEDIIPSFFDEKAGTWVQIDSFTIDKEKNIVIARVKHLTKFSLIAPADSDPPLAPTNAAAISAGEGKVKITWQNPARDFAYAKVYRSDKAGELGKIVAPQVKGQQYIDDTVADGITFYYTVRSVDSAGNESNNQNSANVKAVGTLGSKPVLAAKAMPQSSTAKGTLARNLSQGARGDDVKVLQGLLIKEGFLSSDSATGFLGKLTREAVTRFQEKYAADILRPAGLSKGNGFVGAGTRKKVNELLGK